MAGTVECLDREQLQAFALGHVPQERETLLAGHVESCPVCVRNLAGVEQSDALLDAARRPVPPPPPLLQNLVERVCALSADAEVTQELYGFLDPAESPAELGRLGAYRLLRVLGRGGMGVVFQAEDSQLERQVAVKVLRPALLSSGGARQRFLREARAAARVVHERVGGVLHVGEERGVPYLVMPLLEGETLEARLHREPVLPVPEVVAIGRQVAEALDAAHRHGLIHRDVKPSNVWLEPAAGAKLLDFGLARDVGGPHITRSGAIVGTPAYMAPEQARGEALDARCDLFSLGCLLYRLATGELPFKGDTVLATLRALELETPRPPDAVNPAVPPALADLILRLLAKRREDRCPSATAVVAELTGRRPPPRRRRRRVVRGGLVLGLSVLALTLWLVRPPGESQRGDAPALASELPAHFALQATYAVGKRPYAVAVGDVNGDGKPDLVASNSADDTLSILLGNGDGTFRPALSQAVAGGPHGVLLADFDGDARLDLAVVCLQGNTLTILRNDGAGGFRRHASYPTGKMPRGLTRGDFNRDGRADLAVVNADEGVLNIFLGADDGGFRAMPPYPILDGKNVAITALDLDRDGALDLLVSAGGADAVLVAIGKGDGTFRAARRYTVGSGPGVLVGGDFNRDGHPDVAVENFGTHDVSVLLGNGDGSLRPGGRFAVGAGPGGLAGGDFNADGVLDLVAANHGSHDLSFLIGNGDGSFRPADQRAAGWTPAGVAVGDFNGDGRADVAVVNYKSHTVSVFLNRPPAPLFRLSSPYQVVAGQTYTLTVAALDAHHKPDLAYRGKVRLSASDAQAVLPADVVQPFTLLDGVQAERVQFRSAGLHNWTATDVGDVTRQGSVTILVLPGPTSVLRLRAPSHCTAGVAFPLTVTALDEFANTTPSYTGTLSFSGSDSAAAWPNDTQLDDGERRFEVTLRTPGPQTVTATDRRSVLLSGTTRIVVRPAK